MNTIDVISNLVAQMTPTFNILTQSEIVAGSQWKLENCKTFWLTECQEIEIDGNKYTITEISFNEFIIIEGTVEPTVSFFVVKAPYFNYGTHRKVDGERSEEVIKQEVTPFVYLMELLREVEDLDEMSDIDRTSDIRIFFLDDQDNEGDSLRDTIQQKIIKPMNSAADYFRDLILQQEDKFNRPLRMERFGRPDFGSPAVWGNKESIFEQFLSGVELRFSLEILESNNCDDFCQC